MKKVTVLGSANMDIVVTTDRLPKIGETVIGRQIDYFVGGKGANQAVAAVRAGADVSFLAKIGGDTFGEKVMKHLKEEQLNLEQMSVEKNIFTGMASIFKLPEDNCITVVSGANELVNEVYVDETAEVIKAADILLLQLEIPVGAVHHALKIAKENHVTTILNPAPYDEAILSFLTEVDYLTPNESEFTAMLGKEELNDQELENELILWQKQHMTKLLLTRGKQGVSFVEKGQIVTIPAFNVHAVDTTGAGDTFNGVLAAELSSGKSLTDAVRIANAGSGLSVTKLGAQTGMPEKEEIQNFMNGYQ